MDRGRLGMGMGTPVYIYGWTGRGRREKKKKNTRDKVDDVSYQRTARPPRQDPEKWSSSLSQSLVSLYPSIPIASGTGRGRGPSRERARTLHTHPYLELRRPPYLARTYLSAWVADGTLAKEMTPVVAVRMQGIGDIERGKRWKPQKTRQCCCGNRKAHKTGKIEMATSKGRQGGIG